MPRNIRKALSWFRTTQETIEAARQGLRDNLTSDEVAMGCDITARHLRNDWRHSPKHAQPFPLA